MTWFYPPRQYEIGMLHTLVREGFAANRHVDYARNFAPTAPLAEFRVDGRIELVVAEPDQPPVLRLPDLSGPVEVRVPGEGWQPAVAVTSDSGTPPHLDLEPTVEIELARNDGLWVSPSPVLGRPVFRCLTTPMVTMGESREEALSDPAASESRTDVVQLPDGRWTTQHALGFRYLRIEGSGIDKVLVSAYRRPTPRQGHFACSDELLTRIWDTSACTLHACMHGLMVDGIKRDRMPWIGDQALNTLANAYSFGDRDIVTATLTALGRPQKGYVNGIADYSLWWLIGTGFLTRHFDAADYVRREAAHIHAFTERLDAMSDARGLLHPVPTGDDFPLLVFIDWGVHAEPGRDLTALQILWYWALSSAAELLRAADHPGSVRWAALAEKVRQTLERNAWEPQAGVWREYVDGQSAPSVYPNFLAVLAGLSDGADVGVCSLMASVTRAGTPFMTGFLIRALIVAGRPVEAVARVRELWGGMLDAGATTFWEEFPDLGQSLYEMYGRPFGKSLCHAWSSGPAALLPEAVLGVRSLDHGWARFSVDPQLGELSWAEATIPAPQGDIVISAAHGLVSVLVPEGTTLARADGDHPGPMTVRWSLT